MDELKAYMWDDEVLEAHIVAIVLAHSEEEALKLLETKYGKLSDKQKEAKPFTVNKPTAFVSYFD